VTYCVSWKPDCETRTSKQILMLDIKYFNYLISVRQLYGFITLKVADKFKVCFKQIAIWESKIKMFLETIFRASFEILFVINSHRISYKIWKEIYHTHCIDSLSSSPKKKSSSLCLCLFCIGKVMLLKTSVTVLILEPSVPLSYTITQSPYYIILYYIILYIISELG
jgi:hypothetical protein